MDPFLRALNWELTHSNDHLPIRRIPLISLIGSEDQHFETRSGEKIAFKQSEIQDLASTIHSHFHDRVLLPLLLMQEKDIAKVIGSKFDQWVVEFLLEKTELSPFLLTAFKPSSFLYAHEISGLRRRFSSLIVVGIRPLP